MAAMAVALILVAAAVTIAVDFTSDGVKYTEQLTAMLPCLMFVEGKAWMPMSDCCADTKLVPTQTHGITLHAGVQLP
ncbi:hypothetical protein KSP39_PZI002222 [Platanthera zijinensis]|uniref:Uncharacterized protein n=1 Tax=Platanthera zijinensis TaxID=2320716 RepID=A0AAP0BYY6_9ASPA